MAGFIYPTHIREVPPYKRGLVTRADHQAFQLAGVFDWRRHYGR